MLLLLLGACANTLSQGLPVYLPLTLQMSGTQNVAAQQQADCDPVEFHVVGAFQQPAASSNPERAGAGC